MANQELAGLADYSAGELGGRPWTDIVHPEDRSLVQNLVAGPGVSGTNLRLTAGDGSAVNVRLFLALVRKS